MLNSKKNMSAWERRKLYSQQLYQRTENTDNSRNPQMINKSSNIPAKSSSKENVPSDNRKSIIFRPSISKATSHSRNQTCTNIDRRYSILKPKNVEVSNIKKLPGYNKMTSNNKDSGKSSQEKRLKTSQVQNLIRNTRETSRNYMKSKFCETKKQMTEFDEGVSSVLLHKRSLSLTINKREESIEQDDKSCELSKNSSFTIYKEEELMELEDVMSKRRSESFTIVTTECDDGASSNSPTKTKNASFTISKPEPTEMDYLICESNSATKRKNASFTINKPEPTEVDYLICESNSATKRKNASFTINKPEPTEVDYLICELPKRRSASFTIGERKELSLELSNSTLLTKRPSFVISKSKCDSKCKNEISHGTIEKGKIQAPLSNKSVCNVETVGRSKISEEAAKKRKLSVTANTPTPFKCSKRRCSIQPPSNSTSFNQLASRRLTLPASRKLQPVKRQTLSAAQRKKLHSAYKTVDCIELPAIKNSTIRKSCTKPSFSWDGTKSRATHAQMSSRNIITGKRISYKKSSLKMPFLNNSQSSESFSKIPSKESSNSAFSQNDSKNGKQIVNKGSAQKHTKVKSVTFSVVEKQNSSKKLPKTPQMNLHLRKHIESLLEKSATSSAHRHFKCFGLEEFEIKKKIVPRNVTPIKSDKLIAENITPNKSDKEDSLIFVTPPTHKTLRKRTRPSMKFTDENGKLIQMSNEEILNCTSESRTIKYMVKVDSPTLKRACNNLHKRSTDYSGIVTPVRRSVRISVSSQKKRIKPLILSSLEELPEEIKDKVLFLPNVSILNNSFESLGCK